MKKGARINVAFETFGCRSNFADTVELQAAVLERNARPVHPSEPAEVYVLNTCTVTDDADKTALRALRRLRTKAPQAKIIVTGCMAETSPEKIRHLGLADAVIGPSKRAEVLEAVFDENSQAGSDPHSKKTLPSKREWRSDWLTTSLSEKIPGPGVALGEKHSRARFHLRIQEGCENFCTFCIIPSSRGNLKSKAPELVLEDLDRLHAAGYEEVVLTGTHLGGYGEDIGLSFRDLLDLLARRSPVKRLRLSSIDPNDLTPEIVDIIGESHVFCPHLHICIQAFSDPTLKRMVRRYRLDWVYEILGYIKDRLPECCLGSDVIAGFPGESRQELEQAIQVFLGLPFSYLHVFPYSERSGTAATRLDSVVEVPERKRRTALWRSLSDRRKREFQLRHLGQILEVILEASDGSIVHGMSREFLQVAVNRDVLGVWKPGEKRLLRALSYDEIEGRIVCA